MINFTLNITQLTSGFRADNGNYVIVKNEGKEIGKCRICKSRPSMLGKFTVSELAVTSTTHPLSCKCVQNDS